MFRRRAIRAVHRLLGTSLPPVRPASGPDFGEVSATRDFVVSSGRETWRVTLVEVPESARPLLLFTCAPPPFSSSTR